MALRPLRPTPPTERLADGWDLVASEAGRSNSGLRATLLTLNGESKDITTLLLGHAKQQQAYAERIAALSGIAAAVVLAALPRLAYAIEGLLRQMKTADARDQAGQAFTLPAVEPWPEPVDGATLLDALAQVYTRYLVLPAGGSTVLALWTLHTYVFDSFDVSPYLTLTSPQKRCGKSTVLMVASALCHAPVLVSHATPAALFRLIELVHPTFLVDEAETFVRDNEDLRGILNSGHTRRTAYVLRTVGDDHEPRLFSTWTPKMLAGIGSLPETIRDRSLVLVMHRKTRQERVTKWRERHVDRYAALRRQCVRWAHDHRQALAQADPVVPALPSDRAADNWATLLAIADQAGGAWRRRTEDAIAVLTGGEEDDDSNAGLLLLADLQRAFVEQSVEQIPSETFMDWLPKLEERPWAVYGRAQKPITQRQIAGLLKDFGIRSKDVWINAAAKTKKGYRLAECTDTFARYLPNSPFRSASPRDPNNDAAKADFRSARKGEDLADEKPGFAASPLDSRGLADREPVFEGGDDDFSFDPDADVPF